MTLTQEQKKTLYSNMVRARRLDEKLCQGLADGKAVSFFHSVQGEEAVGVGGCTFLRPDDYIWYHHRGHGAAHLLSKGSSAKEFIAEHYGRSTGSCNGLGSIHSVDPALGILGMSGTIGSAFPVSLGWALACKLAKKEQVTVCFFGDGGSNRGTLHEAMNMASVQKLPIVYVCHNNLYAQFMPLRDSFPSEDIATLAVPYAMPSKIVDGQDVVAVHEAVEEAVARARAGEGPSLIECKTYRYRAHSEGIADISHYEPRPAEEIEAWKKRDPIMLFRQRLLDEGIASPPELEKMEADAIAEMEAAERFAMDSPAPEYATLVQALYQD